MKNIFTKIGGVSLLLIIISLLMSSASFAETDISNQGLTIIKSDDGKTVYIGKDGEVKNGEDFLFKYGENDIVETAIINGKISLDENNSATYIFNNLPKLQKIDNKYVSPHEGEYVIYGTDGSPIADNNGNIVGRGFCIDRNLPPPNVFNDLTQLYVKTNFSSNNITERLQKYIKATIYVGLHLEEFEDELIANVPYYKRGIIKSQISNALTENTYNVYIQHACQYFVEGSSDSLPDLVSAIVTLVKWKDISTEVERFDEEYDLKLYTPVATHEGDYQRIAGFSAKEYSPPETPTTIEVPFSKIAVGGEEELPGATLRVEGKDGKTIDEWISTSIRHDIELPVGEYTLTEIAAPAGYEIAETMAFRVTDDMEVEVYANGNWREVNVVQMQDKIEEESEEPVAKNASVHTTATNSDGGKTIIAEPDTTVIDTVKYEGLDDGAEYRLVGQLVQKTDEKIIATNEKTFTASESGEKSLDFKFDATGITGDLVAYEVLCKGEDKIAEHRDLNDSGQTVTVLTPTIETKAGLQNDGTVEDTVSYSNLTPGRTYTLSGKLVDKTDETKVVSTGSKEFIPDKASGTTTVTFPLSEYGTFVAYEYLSYEGTEIAKHADIGSTAQTVTKVQEIPAPTVTYTETYEFVSADGRELPKAVLDLLPTRSGTYEDGTAVTVAILDGTEVTVGDETWVFHAWKSELETVNGADVHFVGVWDAKAQETPSDEPTTDEPTNEEPTIPATENAEETTSDGNTVAEETDTEESTQKATEEVVEETTEDTEEATEDTEETTNDNEEATKEDTKVASKDTPSASKNIAKAETKKASRTVKTPAQTGDEHSMGIALLLMAISGYAIARTRQKRHTR